MKNKRLEIVTCRLAWGGGQGTGPSAPHPRYIRVWNKSTSLIYPAKKKNPQNKETFKMNDKDFTVEQNTVHVGIKRDISNRVNTEEIELHISI